MRSTTRRIFALASYEPAKPIPLLLLSSVPLAIASGASRLGFMMEVALTSAMMALEKQHALILVPPGANPLDAVSFDAAILIEPAENDPQLQALAQGHSLRHHWPHAGDRHACAVG